MMSTAHSRSHEDKTAGDSSMNRAFSGQAIHSTMQQGASLSLKKFVDPVYADVKEYVLNPENYSGVRSDSVQHNIDKVKETAPQYWTKEMVATILKHIKSSEVLQAMLDEANEAKEVAKVAFHAAVKDVTEKAVASSIAAVGQQHQSIVPTPIIPATGAQTVPAVSVAATTKKIVPKQRAMKQVIRATKPSVKGKKEVVRSPDGVTGTTARSAAGGATSPQPQSEGKSPPRSTPTPDPRRRGARDLFDLADASWEEDEDDSIGSFDDEGNGFWGRHGSQKVQASAKKLVLRALSHSRSSDDVDKMVKTAQAQSSLLNSLAPSALLASMLVGSGLLLMGVSGAVHLVTAKGDAKKRLSFKVSALRGPHGSEAPGRAVNAEGQCFRLIPWSGPDVMVQLSLSRDMAFPGGLSVKAEEAVRMIREQEQFDHFVRVFTMQATRILGTDGWVGPWNGHPNRCSLFLWVVLWSIFHRTITQTMLSKGDASHLLETLEQLLRVASQANLLSGDPAVISSQEMHAAGKILGLRCEGCEAAGFTTVACPTCSTVPRGESYEGPAYYQERDAWKAKDKAARGSLSAAELNRQFKQSTEGKAFQASLAASTSGAASGASKVVTAEACITYIRKNQNKIPQPLESPTISYR